MSSKLKIILIVPVALSLLYMGGNQVVTSVGTSPCDNSTTGEATTEYAELTWENQDDRVTATLVAKQNPACVVEIFGPNGSTKTVDSSGDSVTIVGGDGRYYAVMQGEYVDVRYFGDAPQPQCSNHPLGPPDESSYMVTPSDLTGDGTVETPYRISNALELQAMGCDLTANYVLVDNIDASSTDQWNSGSGFIPIGDGGDAFTGSFDGQSHSIRGLTSTWDDRKNVGLFSQVASTGAIENVRLTSVTIDTASGGEAGGLVGVNSGTVSNATVTGYLKKDSTETASASGGAVGTNYGTMSNVSTQVTLVGEGNSGGLIGRNSGTVADSTASGDVQSLEGQRIGGLIGQNNGQVTNSSADGDVSGDQSDVASELGGLIGENNGQVTNSFATGAIIGDVDIGGLIGENKGTVTNSFAGGDVTATRSAGGLVGEHFAGTVSNTVATGDVTSSSRAGGLVGRQSGGAVRTSFATGGVAGTYTVGGLVGFKDSNLADDPSQSLSYWMDTQPTDSAAGEVNGTDSAGIQTAGGSDSNFTLDDAKGSSAETTLDNLRFGSGGDWRTVDNEYPVIRTIEKQEQLETR